MSDFFKLLAQYLNVAAVNWRLVLCKSATQLLIKLLEEKLSFAYYVKHLSSCSAVALRAGYRAFTWPSTQVLPLILLTPAVAKI